MDSPHPFPPPNVTPLMHFSHGRRAPAYRVKINRRPFILEWGTEQQEKSEMECCSGVSLYAYTVQRRGIKQPAVMKSLYLRMYAPRARADSAPPEAPGLEDMDRRIAGIARDLRAAYQNLLFPRSLNAPFGFELTFLVVFFIPLLPNRSYAAGTPFPRRRQILDGAHSSRSASRCAQKNLCLLWLKARLITAENAPHYGSIYHISSPSIFAKTPFPSIRSEIETFTVL